MNIVERYRRTASSQVMLVLLALIVLMISCSEGLTLRTFLNGYVREDARSGLVAGVPSSPQNNLQPVYPAPATQQKQYVSQSSGLSGGYKSVITVNMVCGMPQFASLCNMMGLRSAFGDVRQNIYVYFDSNKNEAYLKADGHKEIISLKWCGPLSYQTRPVSSTTDEIVFDSAEPSCMRKARKILKKDKYYYNKSAKVIGVNAKIKPHSIVGWVSGKIDLKPCSSSDCIYNPT